MSGAKAVVILAKNTLQDSLRSRVLALGVVFGVVLIYASVLLGLLAADQEVRVLMDFGLSLIEMLGLAAAVYGAATTILREMETKTIYLILTRPIPREAFLLGKFAGLMLSTALIMAVMASAHLALLLGKGWAWSPTYLTALTGIYLKLLITAALTIFLALYSSSVLTALVIAMILWTLGHVLPEIRFLIEGDRSLLKTPLLALSYVVPDLQRLNVRDQSGAGLNPAAWGYVAAYCGVWLYLSASKLKRKEF